MGTDGRSVGQRGHGSLWRRLLVAALLSLPGTGAADALDDLYREHWTTRDGLPHNSINGIVQTPEGYVWFATWEGLVRFNGREFTTFDRQAIPQMRDAALRAVMVNRAGRLFAGGARGGLIRRDTDRRWTALPAAPVMVTDLHEDDRGQLWAGSETPAIYRLDSRGQAAILRPADARSTAATSDLETDPSGRTWAATTTGLMQLVDDRVSPADARGLPAGPVSALAVLPDGRLLAGTPTGLFAADGRATTLAFTAIAPELAGVAVTRLLADPRGGVWIGTLNAGLMHWAEGVLQRLGVGPDKPSTRILSLYLDRQQHLWVGTNGGLFRFIDAPFSSLTQRQGLPDDFVRSVLATTDGGLLVGTAQGLARIDPDGRVTPVGAGTPLASTSILSLTAPTAGELWVGTYGDGVMRWNGEAITARLGTADGLPSSEVRALATAPDGTLWIGTTRGLVQWRDGLQARWTEHDGLPANFIIALLRDARGRLWIGTGTGAAILEEGRLRRLDLQRHAEAEYAFAFLADPDHDAVWIASDRGLLRFDGEGHPTGVIGLAQGLPFEKVFGLLVDGHQRLWLSGNRGLVRVDLAQAHAVAGGQVATLTAEHFTEADGMLSAQGNGGSQPVAALDGQGRPWFATAMGAVRVDVDDLERSSLQAPPVVIESLVADGVAYAPDATPAIRLPPGTRRVEVHFAGLGFLLADRLRYRTRLEGYDDEWVERIGRTETEFTGLPPGTYRFVVQSAHPRGPWGEDGATLAFEIPAHWWQRRWVPIAAAWLLLIGAFGLYRLRLRRLTVNERRLARIVDERTAEIERQKGLLAEQADEFARQAREDALTGIANRRDFDERLARAFTRAHHANEPLCVALLDIDHFKRVNDHWSHAVGDIVLRRLAELLRDRCRPTDSVARWGGEEFAVLLPGTPHAEGRQACERLRQAIEALDFGDIDPALRITASFGLAAAEDAGDHDQLMRRADEALYRAKQNGRNRVEA